MEFKGLNGQCSLDGEWVTISRKGFMARSAHGGGEVRIPLYGLAAVEWRAPTRLTNGFIAFVPVGSGVKDKRAGHMAVDAARDANAVTLQFKHLAAASAFRDAVELAMAGGSGPAGASGAAEVARLVELHAAGHLTDAEFAAAKAKALGL